jgi:exosortase/archaeosortase family protein
MSLKQVIENPGFIFIVKFLVLFLGLHFFNEFYIGITAPGNLYIPFLEEHLNYVNWLRSSILYTSQGICNVFGYSSYVEEPYLLKSVTGVSVRMVYTCIGLGIMSLWTGFVLAHSISWKQKLLWAMIGLIVIWVVNCFRVAILLMASVNQWNPNKYIDHHDTFNIIAYIFIAVLVVLFLRKHGLQRNKVGLT